MTIYSWAINLVKVLGGVITVSVLLLIAYQDKLLYHPNPPQIPKTVQENPPGLRSPQEYKIDGSRNRAQISSSAGDLDSIPFEDVYVETSDNEKIHAWLLLQKNSENVPTLIYFHGNAGNMGLRLPNAALMYALCRINVLLMDYRGYGSSTGVPSELGLKLDASAVLEFAKKHPKLTNSKLVLFGRSLGGAVAVNLAAEKPDFVSGVVLENTFLSVSAMVDSLMPFLIPIKPLVLRIGWNSASIIPSLKQPILFVSGDSDELVPPAHMHELNKLAVASVSKTFKSVQGGQHNDSFHVAGKVYYIWLKEFVDNLSGIRGNADSNGTFEANDASSCDVNDPVAAIPLPTMGRNFIVK